MASYEQNKKYAEKYLSKMDEIRIRMTKESGLKDAIQTHAKDGNESVQAFIIRAIMETMERDNELQAKCYKLLNQEEEG